MMMMMMTRKGLARNSSLNFLAKNAQIQHLQKRSVSNFFAHGNIGLAVLRRKDPEHVHHTDPGHDAEVWRRPEMVGPGTSDASRVPTQEELSVGKERLEFMARREGKDPYYGLMDPIPSDRMGTTSNPIEVPSPDDDRIVGCAGYSGSVDADGNTEVIEHRHQTEWFSITEDGHRYWEYGHNRCPECGNTFKLKKIKLPYESIF